MNKRAQMEVFGLAMVVILIFIGMVFAMRFFQPRSTEDMKDTYTDEVIAQNMVTAIFNLNTTCALDMAELAKDCRIRNQYECRIDGEYVKSCAYVNKTISNILENTLEKWKKPYEFSISGTDINLKYGDCSRLKKVSGTQLISLYPEGSGSILVSLDIFRS
jgi:hypothetical protein